MSVGKTALEISEALGAIRSLVPEGVEIVAVSKFQPVESLRAAYDAGQRLFGESRVQELLEKIPQMPSDIRWHFIGHLQTNKVKAIIGKTALIESIDSVRLLELIDLESGKKGVKTAVLLQLHVAREETKFGFSPEEVTEYFRSGKYKELNNVEIRGLMAMATNTDDLKTVREDFARAAAVMREIKTDICPGLKEFETLSMGMSGDWPIAVEEGATLVRIGSAIFGERN